MQKWGNKYSRLAKQTLESTPDPRIKQGKKKKKRQGSLPWKTLARADGEIVRTDVRPRGSEFRLMRI